MLFYFKGAGMIKTRICFFLLLVALCFSGCETLKGFTKDIQNTGDNIWATVTNK